MLIKPRPPRGAQRIAGLQHAAQPRSGAAPHQAQMPATLDRHQFENDTGLAVPFNAENNAFVGPLHGDYLPVSRARRSTQLSAAPRPGNETQIIPSGIPGPFPDSVPDRRPTLPSL